MCFLLSSVVLRGLFYVYRLRVHLCARSAMAPKRDRKTAAKRPRAEDGTDLVSRLLARARVDPYALSQRACRSYGAWSCAARCRGGVALWLLRLTRAADAAAQGCLARVALAPPPLGTKSSRASPQRHPARARPRPHRAPPHLQTTPRPRPTAAQRIRTAFTAWARASGAAACGRTSRGCWRSLDAWMRGGRCGHCLRA